MAEDGAAGDDGTLRTGEAPEDPVYEVLFRLGGKPYEVLVNPPGSLMVEYLDRIRNRGGSLGISWMLEQMLRTDAYKALRDSPKVSKADRDIVISRCVDLILGNRAAAPKSPKPESPPEAG